MKTQHFSENLWILLSLRSAPTQATPALDGGNGMPFVGREVEGCAKSGVFMRVRFVSVKAPEVAAITMVKGPVFLEKFAGSWRFRALSDHQTLARFSYSLSAPA